MSERDLTCWKYQRYLKDYLRCVRGVDDSVGQLLRYLDESGLAKNTVVIYSSDQGFYLGEHGWYDKRWMFEQSLQMPFLIRYPGVVKPGSKPNALIQNIDYAPTFLEMAGVTPPSAMQGKSILPVLKNPKAQHRDTIYYAYYGENTHNVALHDGVRNNRYKLVRFAQTNEWNLFDLKTDPQEMRSVHDNPAYATVLRTMQALYQQERQRYEVNVATVPAHRNNEGWWKTRHEQKMQQARRGNHDLIFIGDSITQGWEGAGKAAWDKHFASKNPLNLGFSGDRTEHVLWRLTTEEFWGQKPKAVVLMIGTNNTGHRMGEASETASGIRQIVALIQDRSPQTRILLLGIFPRGATSDDKMRVRNREINALIQPLHDGRRVVYRDISDTFLTPDGTLPREIMPDLLHLNPDGYAKWAEAIAPLLTTWGV
jgi:N-acetylglucosamine-6-sulfatase